MKIHNVRGGDTEYCASIGLHPQRQVDNPITLWLGREARHRAQAGRCRFLFREVKRSGLDLDLGARRLFYRGDFPKLVFRDGLSARAEIPRAQRTQNALWADKKTNDLR